MTKFERLKSRGPSNWQEAKIVLVEFGKSASHCMASTNVLELRAYQSELLAWLPWLETCLAIRDDEMRRLEREVVHLRIATEIVNLDELREHNKLTLLELPPGKEWDTFRSLFEE